MVPHCGEVGPGTMTYFAYTRPVSDSFSVYTVANMFILNGRIVFFVVIIVSEVSSQQEQRKRANPTKIAVIGGGIGGSSASYFIRDKFGDDVDIDLFEESSEYCGRLATVNFAGREYESGGSIIHPRNKYMKTFVDTIPGLEMASDRPGGTLGLFDGHNYVVRTSNWKIITFLRLFWNFGFDLRRIQTLEEEFLDKFDRIYDLQAQGQSFDDVSSLLYGIAGEDFLHATQITAEELFLEHGIGKFTIDNLVTPALRNNYGQNASANGFVGAVAMAGIQSGLWSVKGGNKRVCEKLVEESSLKVIHENVTHVKYQAERESGKFVISTNYRLARYYDIVIIAAPIRRDVANFIDVSQACANQESCPGSQADHRQYRRTVANFVHGKLNSSLFQCDSIDECPYSLMMPNQDTFYRSIGIHVPVDFNPKIDRVQQIYKVFTTEPMTDEQRNYLFEAYSDTATVDWMAYPHYHPPDTLGSFVLNPEGLYYTSPIEWAASAMEMSVISAKNAVLLAYNNWHHIAQNMAHSDEIRSPKEDL